MFVEVVCAGGDGHGGRRVALGRGVTLGGEAVVRAGRRWRDDATTAFFLGPAATSARGATTRQSAGWLLGESGLSAALVVAASEKIVCKLVRSCSCSWPRWRVWCPQSWEARSAAAARMASAGVMAGLVRYLCLAPPQLLLAERRHDNQPVGCFREVVHRRRWRRLCRRRLCASW